MKQFLKWYEREARITPNKREFQWSKNEEITAWFSVSMCLFILFFYEESERKNKSKDVKRSFCVVRSINKTIQITPKRQNKQK